MRGGHNRLPRAVKAKRGTLKKARETAPQAPDLPPGNVPPPPADLAAAEVAVWRELATQVEALGCYTSSDYSAFKLMVRMYALTDAGPGDAAPSAYAKIAQTAVGLLARFGLDPASRGRVPRPDAEKPSADEESAMFGVINGGKAS
jgi:hypothetical protein